MSNHLSISALSFHVGFSPGVSTLSRAERNRSRPLKRSSPSASPGLPIERRGRRPPPAGPGAPLRPRPYEPGRLFLGEGPEVHPRTPGADGRREHVGGGRDEYYDGI